jgi:hypothetical protein
MTGHAVKPVDVPEDDQTPETWHCIDCSVNTAPGFPNRAVLRAGIAAGSLSLYTPNQEVYTVTPKVWRKAGNPAGWAQDRGLPGK